jgi:hypothetical protein
MGGLLPPIGHPLLGQRLTQPGMLVVHVLFPSCNSAAAPATQSSLVVAGWLRIDAKAFRPNPAPAICRAGSLPHL